MSGRMNKESEDKGRVVLPKLRLCRNLFQFMALALYIRKLCLAYDMKYI